MYDILTLQAWIQAVYDNDPQTGGARLWMEPFAYSAAFGAFSGVAGQSASVVVQVNATSDFFCTRINYGAGLSAAFTVGALPVVQARLQITDQGSGNQFFNTPALLENIAAHQYPTRFLTLPRYCAANTSLLLQLTGVGTAADAFTYVDVVLEGVRVRRFSNGVAVA